MKAFHTIREAIKDAEYRKKHAKPERWAQPIAAERTPTSLETAIDDLLK
jgi:hypothetical protein